MNKTTLLFARNENATISTFGVVTISSKDSKDPNVLIDKFKAGVTDWINQTEDGKEVWDQSSSDLNIGDIAGYEHDESLNDCLAEYGINFEIDVMNDCGNVLPYDTVLANESDITASEDD